MVSILLSLAALSAAQPAGAQGPLVVELCNQTSVRVAYSITYPAGVSAQRRRGWLTVAPGGCVNGSIGRSTGGTALVHAMSGAYAWPGARGSEAVCVPASSHDDPARRPPCADGEREASAAAVAIASAGGRHTRSYTVACSDLDAPDAALCATGRTGPSGFAQLVRTLEVCNATRGATSAALAAQTPDGSWRVEGWRELKAGECVEVWRGLSTDQVAYLHAPDIPAGGDPADVRRFCVDPDRAFDRLTPQPAGEAACADGLELRSFRAVRFGDDVSAMSFTFEQL